MVYSDFYFFIFFRLNKYQFEILATIFVLACIRFLFFFSWARFGKTIGMKAWKLELVRPRNSKFNFFCLRYILATLSLLCLGLGFLIFIFKKNFAHDLILKSKIIYAQTYGS